MRGTFDRTFRRPAIAFGRMLRGEHGPALGPAARFVRACIALAICGPVLISSSGSVLSADRGLHRAEPRPIPAKADAVPDSPGAWRVLHVEGSALYSDRGMGAEDWRMASAGLTLDEPTVVRTPRDGRAELFNGRDSVTLSPRSEIALPAERAASEPVQVLQSRGSVAYHVASPRPTGLERLLSGLAGLFLAAQPTPTRFEVRTPYLVVLVKGTRFTVRVGEDTARVRVTEGAVAVADLLTGATYEVRAGQTATAGVGVSIDFAGGGSLAEGLGTAVGSGLETTTGLVGGVTAALGSTVETTADTIDGLGETVNDTGLADGTGGAIGGADSGGGDSAGGDGTAGGGEAGGGGLGGGLGGALGGGLGGVLGGRGG